MAQHSLSRSDRKSALIAELARSRSAMAGSFRDSRESLNSARSVASHKALWLGGAAISGWLLGKLTGSKPRAKTRKTIPAAPLAPAERSGWILALLGALATMLRPAVTSYLTHRLNDYLTRPAANDHRGSFNPLRR